MGKRREQYLEATRKMVDGLRRDAFDVAQELGLVNLRVEGRAAILEEGRFPPE